uniref:Uncharacterized protein n=1 Tax=Mycena chlorophos TaxID=658473 RepID=A0ABQ0L288_MYCCL|nr:predicted protein [Mycena chlorophos]
MQLVAVDDARDYELTRIGPQPACATTQQSPRYLPTNVFDTVSAGLRVAAAVAVARPSPSLRSSHRGERSPLLKTTSRRTEGPSCGSREQDTDIPRHDH